MRTSISELNRKNYENRHPMWKDLDLDTYNALCNCCNTYEEIPKLARSVYHYFKEKKPKYSPEDALVYILEHLEANSQDFMSSIQRWQYEEILGEIV